MAGSEHTKNTIRHHVYAISKFFGIDPSKDTDIYKYADWLEQSLSSNWPSQINIQKALDKVCKNNPLSSAFLKKYDELKFKNIRELGPCVHLLSKLKYEAEILKFIEGKTQQNRNVSHHSNSMKNSEFTFEKKTVNQLQQMIANCGLSTANTIQQISSERQRSVDYTTIPGRSVSGISANTGQPIPSRRALSTVNSNQTGQQMPKFPLRPDWLIETPELRDDYLETKNEKNHQYLPIESLSQAVQEYAIIGDLLQCLQGNRGVYVKPQPLPSHFSTRTFTVDEKMNPVLLESVNRILPMCSDYSTIVRFIDDKSVSDHGFVNQALASAMGNLLKSYRILLCQLEQHYNAGQLGIAQLQFYLQDTMPAFNQLAGIATNINMGDCSGGATLSLLYDAIRNVHPETKVYELIQFVLCSATVPFFKILQKWIYRGVISDPYKEFFIAMGPMSETYTENMSKTQGGIIGLSDQGDKFAQDYVDWAYFWERVYSIVRINLPSFLEQPAYKILNTGKYLNVVQQCADIYEMPVCEELVYSPTDSSYLDQIDRAHSYASSLLMRLMLTQKDLKEHFKSIKRFFLLDQGDFIVHFMDTAAKELKKPSTEVSWPRLSSLLELALRTSTANSDLFKDNLVVVISKFDLITQILMVLRAGSEDDPSPLPFEDKHLSGLEAFSLDYCVAWPVSLVLNRQVMDRYQMLFRHLLHCKHVERLLCNAWILGKLARRSDNIMSTWFTTAFLLAQRMLTFIQHFQYYMSVEIIEPTWQNFSKQIDKLSNLDALLDAHLHCLEVCMDDCLLASPDLLSLIGKISVVCVMFSNFVQHLAMSTTGINLTGTDSDPISLGPRSWEDVNQQFSRIRHGQNSSSNSDESILTRVTTDDLIHAGTSEAFAQTVMNFDSKFNNFMIELLDKLTIYSKERNKLLSLVARLNFNNFYTEYASTVAGHYDDTETSSTYNPSQPPRLVTEGSMDIHSVHQRERKPRPPQHRPYQDEDCI